MVKIKKQWRIYFGEVMGKPRLLAVNCRKKLTVNPLNKKEMFHAFEAARTQAEALSALLDTDIADRFVEYSKRCGVTAVAGRIDDYVIVHAKEEVSWADIEHKTLLILDEGIELFDIEKETKERQQSCVMFNVEHVL